MFVRDTDLIISVEEGKILLDRKANPTHFVNWVKTHFEGDTEIRRVVAKSVDIVDGNIVFNEQVIFDLEAA